MEHELWILLNTILQKVDNMEKVIMDAKKEDEQKK